MSRDRISYGDCIACGGTHHARKWPIGDGRRWTFIVCPATRATLVIDSRTDRITRDVVVGPDVQRATEIAIEEDALQ